MRVNRADTHPIVRVVFVLVEKPAADVACSVTISHALTDPATVVNVPPLILYAPPTTEMAVGPVIPETVMGLDVYTVESSVPVIAVKLKAFGTVSAGAAKAKRDNWLVVNMQFPAPVTTQLEISV